MLPADWSISPLHDPLPSSCHSKKMLWNPSILSMVVVSLPLSLSTLLQFLVNLSPHLSFSPLSLSLVAVKRRYTVDHKSVKPGAKVA